MESPVKLAVLVEWDIVWLPEGSVDDDGGGGTDKTAISFKSCRFKLGLSANAVPMTLRSAHNDPVGILTSILVPR